MEKEVVSIPMSNRVVHFEIHATDPERLGKFYTDLFGWAIDEWKVPGAENMPQENRYWGVMTAPKDSKEPGINGGLLFRKGPAPKGGEPVSAFICTIQVPNVDEYLEKTVQLGGQIAVPKMPISGLAWLAYGKDPEGNIFGMFEEDKNAK